MSSVVTIHKQNGIIAFYNIFSDKLRLQECKEIAEVEYLLHTAVKFIQRGCLKYYDHSGFGFSQTVDFLNQQLQPCFHSLLDPKAAEQGDEFERVKIFVALLYAFRLLQTSIFEDWVNSLSWENNMQIAEIVGFLDSSDFWASPDTWPEILWKPSVTDASSPIASPSYAASPEVGVCESVTFFGGVVTPQSNKMLIYKSSPISSVLKSASGVSAPKVNQMRRSGGQSRASQIAKINHLHKCLIEKKEQLKITGAELDAYQSKCQKLEEENASLLDQNKKLEKKLADWRAKDKECEILQQQIGELVRREALLTKSNDSLLAERDSSVSFRRQLSAERDDALKRLDLAKEEASELDKALKKLSQDFRTEMANHSVTRQKFSKLIHEHMLNDAKCKELEATLEELKVNGTRNLQHLQDRLEEKEQALADQELVLSSLHSRAEAEQQKRFKEEIEMKSAEIMRLQDCLEKKDQALIDQELSLSSLHFRAEAEHQNRFKEEMEMKSAEIMRLELENKTLREAEKQKISGRADTSIASSFQSVMKTPRLRSSRPRAFEGQTSARNQVKVERFQASSETKPGMGRPTYIPLSSDTTSIHSKETTGKGLKQFNKQTEEERLHQLKERNKKQPKHLQESYLPEINGMSKDARVIEETKSKSPFRHFNCFGSARKR